MVVPASSLRFGPFRWDARNRLLLRDGTEVPLPPRVLAVLECLLERPGEVLSRQELTERVWRDAFVTDTSLAEAISFLRQALGDDAQEPRYIQTIHRRGYRFVAAVEPESAEPVKVAAPWLPAATAKPTVKPSIGGQLVPWSLVVLLGATLAVAIWKLTHPSAAVQPRVTRFEMIAPERATFRRDSNHLAVSPDGRLIAFAACDGSVCPLFLRDLDDVAPRALEGTNGAAAPFFSPDGRSVGFFADGKLKRMPVTGGTPTILGDAPEALGAAWLEDGRILFAAHETGGLEAISENGGPPVRITRVDAQAGEIGHRAPHWLPGTAFVIFTSTTSRQNRLPDRAMALPLGSSSGRFQVIASRASAAMLIAPDILVFSRGQELEAARFDPARGLLAGAPIPVLHGLETADDGMPLFASSAQGTLIQVSGPDGERQFTLASSSGSRELAAAFATVREPALDRRGQHLAGIVSDGLRGDLWVGETARGTMTRLTNTYPAAAPVWSPDGQRLVFSAAAGGPFNLWEADPAGPSSRRLLDTPMHQFASEVTAGGEVVFTQIDPVTRGDIWLRRGDGALTPLVRTTFDERDAVMSPDRRWLAYLSDESGRWQVYVKDLEGNGRSVVSQGAARRTWWLEDGRLVYTTAAGALAQARVGPEGPVSLGAPRGFGDASVIAVSASGMYLLSRFRQPLRSPTVTIEGWRDIWRALPPAVGTLPR